MYSTCGGAAYGVDTCIRDRLHSPQVESEEGGVAALCYAEETLLRQVRAPAERKGISESETRSRSMIEGRMKGGEVLMRKRENEMKNKRKTAKMFQK